MSIARKDNVRKKLRNFKPKKNVNATFDNAFVERELSKSSIFQGRRDHGGAHVHCKDRQSQEEEVKRQAKERRERHPYRTPALKEDQSTTKPIPKKADGLASLAGTVNSDLTGCLENSLFVLVFCGSRHLKSGLSPRTEVQFYGNCRKKNSTVIVLICDENTVILLRFMQIPSKWRLSISPPRLSFPAELLASFAGCTRLHSFKHTQTHHMRTHTLLLEYIFEKDDQIAHR